MFLLFILMSLVKTSVKLRGSFEIFLHEMLDTFLVSLNFNLCYLNFF